RYRNGVSAAIDLGDPQFFAGILVESPKSAVVAVTNEDQPAARDDTPTDPGCAGVGYSFLCQRFDNAQGFLPDDGPFLEIDGRQRAPGGRLQRAARLVIPSPGGSR